MNNILLISPKFPHNVGAAIRAMSCYGGGELLWTGDRVDPTTMSRLPREERMKGYSDVQWDHVVTHRPIDLIQRRTEAPLTPVAIELLPGSEPLHTFEHPENAVYIFGPEDGHLPPGIRSACHRFVQIPSAHCLNLSAAVYIVLYDRMVKRVAAGLDHLPNIDGEQRGWWHSPSIETGV